MKKIISTFIIVMLVASSYGQNWNRTQWEAGLEFGGALAWMCGKYYEGSTIKHKPIFRPAFAAMGAYNFNSMLAITMGLGIVKAGVLFSDSYEYEGEYSYTDRWRFSTLRINLEPHRNMRRGDVWRLVRLRCPSGRQHGGDRCMLAR